MNGAVDFSNPYCVLQTNSKLEGHGVVCSHISHFFEFVLKIHLDIHDWPRK